MHPYFSRSRIQLMAFALFIMGLITLFFLPSFWPGITLVIGIPLALRQFLLGKVYDSLVCLLVFVGLFLSDLFYGESLEILFPILFTMGGMYIFLRDLFSVDELSEEEEEENLNLEIEEDTTHHDV